MRLGDRHPSVSNRRRFGSAAVGRFPTGGRRRTAPNGKGVRSNLCEAGHRPKVGRGPSRQIGPDPFSVPFIRCDLVSDRRVTVLSGKPLLSTRERTVLSFQKGDWLRATSSSIPWRRPYSHGACPLVGRTAQMLRGGKGTGTEPHRTQGAFPIQRAARSQSPFCDCRFCVELSVTNTRGEMTMKHIRTDMTGFSFSCFRGGPRAPPSDDAELCEGGG